jgi:hypothetical protein
VTVEHTDGPLPIAKRRLADGVHALADEQPVWDGRVCRWQPALYDRLRAHLVGVQGVRRVRAASSSRLPCSLPVLDLLVAIDTTSRRWTPEEKRSTIERLRSLTHRGWRPMDVDAIEAIVDQLAMWTVAATSCWCRPCECSSRDLARTAAPVTPTGPLGAKQCDRRR